MLHVKGAGQKTEVPFPETSLLPAECAGDAPLGGSARVSKDGD